MKLMLSLLSLCILMGCSKDRTKPNVEVIQDMMEQPALKAQDFHPYDREKSSMLTPPPGTQPKNRKPYLYSGKPVEAGKNLRNPFANDRSEAFLQRGKIHFGNFCMVCHGDLGKGDGPVAAKWQGPKIPSLMTDKIRGYGDGRIFHIITEGQGIMNPYIHQLPNEEDRWAVVNYIRSLQKL